MSWTVAVVVWVSCGFVFWLDTLRYNGLPTAWKSKPRNEGWDTILYWYLPLSLLLGPICWIVLVAYKVLEE